MKPSVLRRVVLGLLVVGVAIQLYRPARTNPAGDPATSLTAAAPVPSEVAAVLKRSCYDCHSSETRWPWYSNVAPVSWGVIGHVNEARGHFNFSEWGNYSPARRATILENICDEVREGGMPLASYLLLHWDARLSHADRKAICGWATEAGGR
jgi:hypothetical protein